HPQQDARLGLRPAGGGVAGQHAHPARQRRHAGADGRQLEEVTAVQAAQRVPAEHRVAPRSGGFSLPAPSASEGGGATPPSLALGAGFQWFSANSLLLISTHSTSP